MRFVTVVGARPQFIKAAPLSKVLRERHSEFLVHTGQHYDDNMSDVFFRELNIPLPDRFLRVGSAPHGEQTAAMLHGIEKVLLEVRPDAMIVYGDTNSTLAGALAAAKLNIPVAHVEAGLRSFDRRMPEEVNRVVTDHLSHWLFAPSKAACHQLTHEGIVDRVYDVGDIMGDSIRHFSPVAARSSDILERHGLVSGCFGVATLHRAANTDDPTRLRGILEALQSISTTIKRIVVPLHPRTRAAIEGHKLQYLLDATGEDGAGRLIVISPVGYLDMLQLLQNSSIVLTDSGGLQKEAYYLGKPCVTLREETEWPETVAAGWNRLSGTDSLRITAALDDLLSNPPRERPMIYGDGHAANKIAEVFEQ